MTQATLLDGTHRVILETFVSRRHAPHHAEIPASLGVAQEEGRRLAHELVATGMPVWLQPGTDLIASCAAFNEVPTPYRASVDGMPGWFVQCGFEALAMPWVSLDRAALPPRSGWGPSNRASPRSR